MNITFRHLVSLGSSWLWQFLRISMTLTVVRSTGHVFYKAPLNWDLSDGFLMIGLGLWALGYGGKVPSHHIVSAVHALTVTVHSWC